MCEEKTISQCYTLPLGKDFVLLESLPKYLKEEVLRYVKIKCKEQRVLCSINARLLPLSDGGYIDKKKIIDSELSSFNQLCE